MHGGEDYRLTCTLEMYQTLVVYSTTFVEVRSDVFNEGWLEDLELKLPEDSTSSTTTKMVAQ